MKLLIKYAVLFVAVGLLILLATRGNFKDKLLYQDDLATNVGSPFESSNSNSRYALTQSLAENRSVFFDGKQAAFSAPDVVYYKGKYFTVFLPGVSFLGVPFYIVGKAFGIPQLLTYFLNMVLMLINGLMVYLLARSLKVSRWAAYSSVLIFIFATNVLAYSQTYTQHMLSTFLILSAALIAFNRPSFKLNLLIGFLFGYSFLVDVPNVLILIPIGLYWLSKHFDLSNEKLLRRINFSFVAIIFGVLVCASIFGYYNYLATGSPVKFGQQIGRSDYPPQTINPQEKPVVKSVSPYESKLALNTRNILNGIYILLISDERGVFYYSPILLVTLVGLYLAAKNRVTKSKSILLFAVSLITLITYAMFSDPWGGWSFGARYMIPAIAVMSPLIAVALTVKRRNLLLLALVLALTLFSVRTGVLGAITTNAIPPKQEAERLITPIPYTTEYNLDLLDQGKVSSLPYNLWLNKFLSPLQFYNVYVGLVMVLILISLLANMKFYEENK